MVSTWRPDLLIPFSRLIFSSFEKTNGKRNNKRRAIYSTDTVVALWPKTVCYLAEQLRVKGRRATDWLDRGWHEVTQTPGAVLPRRTPVAPPPTPREVIHTGPLAGDSRLCCCPCVVASIRVGGRARVDESHLDRDYTVGFPPSWIPENVPKTIIEEVIEMFFLSLLVFAHTKRLNCAIHRAGGWDNVS